MASRLYFPATEAAAVSPTISSTDWGHIEASPVRRRLRRDPDDASTLTTVATTFDAADHLTTVNALHRQYVSDPLSEQSLAGNIKAQLQVLEANTANNISLTIKAYIVSNDGTSERGTLIAVTRDGTEANTSLRNLAYTSAALSNVNVVRGDRLVLEIGLGGLPTSASGTNDHDGSIRWGTNASGGDLAENETETGTTFRGWVEFSQTIAWDTERTATVGGAALTGETPALRTNTIPTPAAAALILTGVAPTVQEGTGGEDTPRTPSVGALALVGASLTLALEIRPTVAELTLTGAAPGVVANTFVGPVAAGALTLTGAASTTALLEFRTPAAAALTLAGGAPVITNAREPGAGVLAVAGAAPILGQTAHVALTPAAGEMAATGARPGYSGGAQPDRGPIPWRRTATARRWKRILPGEPEPEPVPEPSELDRALELVAAYERALADARAIVPVDTAIQPPAAAVAAVGQPADLIDGLAWLIAQEDEMLVAQRDLLVLT